MARILVIDEDAEMRAMLLQMLTAAGHQVALAAEGGQGMELFRATPADLLVTNLFMPNQEGLKTIVHLRRDIPKLPIIAICGKRDATDMLSAARRLGALQTLEEPLLSQEVLSVIAEVLQPRPDGPSG